MPWVNGDERSAGTWVPDSFTPGGISQNAYQNAIGTAIGETYANQRGVTDLAPIFDTMATRAENPSMYVPPGYRDANDPLNSVITAPSFGNYNLPQYNTQSPQFPAAYQQYLNAFGQATPQNFNESGYYTGNIPGMQNAAIAAYGVFGGGGGGMRWDTGDGRSPGGWVPDNSSGGPLRGIALDADSYANTPSLSRSAGQLNQGEFPIAFGAGDRAHYFNANPDYSQYSYPGAQDTTGGVINATTGYFGQYMPQPTPVTGGGMRWDTGDGRSPGGWVPAATQPMPPMQDYNTTGSYNPAGLQPSFTGPYNYGYPDSSYGGGYPTQFSGDAAAGYNNPAFSNGGNQSFTGGGGRWDPGDGRSPGGWVPDSPGGGYGNSIFNSINQMMPGIGGAANWGDPWAQLAKAGGNAGYGYNYSPNFGNVNTYNDGSSFYGNNEYGYGGGYGDTNYNPPPNYLDQFNQTPAAYNSLNFTVGGPSGGGGGHWDTGDGRSAGAWVADSPGGYAAGAAYSPGYSIQPGTAAASYGGGMTSQDAAAQAQTYNDLQSRLASEAAFYSAQQAALPSSPQNYQSQIVNPYYGNFGGFQAPSGPMGFTQPFQSGFL